MIDDVPHDFESSRPILYEGGEEIDLSTVVDEDRLELARAAYGVIKRGSANRKAVRALQDRLNYLGYGISNDGIFGSETEDALKKFQESRGAKLVDGIVGPETLGKLLRAHPKKASPTAPDIASIQKVVQDGAAQTYRRAKDLGDIRAQQQGGQPDGRQPGESAQARRDRGRRSGTAPKGPNGGAIDPVTGAERATSSTGPIGSTQVQQPSNMTFEQAHPREPGGQFISKGSQGQQVKRTQRQLNNTGHNVKEDGQFGPVTDQAVKQFQQEHGLVVDGIVGPKTRAKLTVAARRGRQP